jgi:hypothetical protein
MTPIRHVHLFAAIQSASRFDAKRNRLLSWRLSKRNGELGLAVIVSVMAQYGSGHGT